MNHPMQPTPEQIREWFEEAKSQAKSTNDMNSPAAEVARLAYAAGADAELEACARYLPSWSRGDLRAARRPKPPSLKEQALDALRDAECIKPLTAEYEIIRRAIEALPEEAP